MNKNYLTDEELAEMIEELEKLEELGESVNNNPLVRGFSVLLVVTVTAMLVQLTWNVLFVNVLVGIEPVSFIVSLMLSTIIHLSMVIANSLITKLISLLVRI